MIDITIGSLHDTYNEKEGEKVKQIQLFTEDSRSLVMEGDDAKLFIGLCRADGEALKGVVINLHTAISLKNALDQFIKEASICEKRVWRKEINEQISETHSAAIGESLEEVRRQIYAGQ